MKERNSNFKEIEIALYKHFGDAKYYNVVQVFNNKIESSSINISKIEILEMYLIELKWRIVIEKMLTNMNDKNMQQFVQLKYTKKYSEVQLCKLLHIEKTTLYQWRKDMLYNTLLYAVQDNLLML